MKWFKEFSRLVAGLVFVFSGFVKAIDPLGSTYKFVDYFNAFGIGFLESMALPLAVLLSTVELVLGITLLLGFRMRIASWILLVFMSFFTILTFILALTNPVHDCGCFGDALILTNWQTFWKNVVLMIFTLVVFLSRNHYRIRYGKTVENSIIVGFMILTVTLSVYCINYLPFLDFRPYQIGTHIPDAMTIPEGAPENEYETVLIYRNLETGEEQEFTLENFPRDTAKWEFVDAVSTLVSKGYEPPIHDFNIVAPDGNDITDAVLSNKEYTFLFIAYDLEKANSEVLRYANNLSRLALIMPDLDFYAVTASVQDKIDAVTGEYNLEYTFNQADEITLKTIVRANPGLLLIKSGTIIGKWHYNRFPSPDKLEPVKQSISDFPFCRGCEFKNLMEPPLGTPPDEFITTLYYRNLETDSIHAFSMEDFPRDAEKWTFHNSETIKKSGGIELPMDAFQVEDLQGMDISSSILSEEGSRVLIFIKDTESLPSEIFDKFNKFGGMAWESFSPSPEVFALIGEEVETVLQFSEQYPSAFDYFIIKRDFLENMDFNHASVVLILNGKVLAYWKDEDIPDPMVLAEIDSNPTIKPADTVFLPLQLSRLNNRLEESVVYLFILGFFFLTALIKLSLYSAKEEKDAQDFS